MDITIELLSDILRFIIELLVDDGAAYFDILKAIAAVIGPLVSTLIAYLTWQVYQEQNDLIEEQTQASKEAQRASVQSLEVASQNRNELSVIVKNSGRGAAKGLQGKVKFIPQDDIGLETKPYRSRAIRQSSSGLTEKNNEVKWIPSAGNELAAGESEVQIGITCFGEIEGEDDPVTFSRMMSIIETSYIIEVLRRMAVELTETQLTELYEEDWNEHLRELAEDPDYDSLAEEFDMNNLERLQVTIGEKFDVNENKFPVNNSFEFNVSLEYRDEFTSYETPILQLIPNIDKSHELEDILSGDYSRQRRESDPRGHELNRLS